MGGVGSGDKLARGGHSATWGPMDSTVSKEKWEAIFGQESNIVNLKDIPVSDGSGAVSYRFTRKKKKEKKNANHHAGNTGKRPSNSST